MKKLKYEYVDVYSRATFKSSRMMVSNYTLLGVGASTLILFFKDKVVSRYSNLPNPDAATGSSRVTKSFIL